MASLIKEKVPVSTLFFFLFFIFGGGFKTGFLYIALIAQNSVDQASFKLIEIYLSLPLSPGIKGVCHHYMAVQFIHKRRK